MRKQWKHFVWLAFLSAVAMGCNSSSRPGSLVERVDEAQGRLDSGTYPNFVEEPQLAGPVDLLGEVRQSLTPPFPSGLSFEIQVPEAGFLEFSPALVMVQGVRRAKVEFLVTATSNLVTATSNNEETVVYSEVLRARHANKWQDRHADLTPWAGRRVLLTLETRAVPPRADILWADRIQTAWGDPVVVERAWKPVVDEARRSVADSFYQLEELLVSSGVGPQNQITAIRLALSLVLGGFLSICVRELYKRFCATRTHRESFANMLPLFTLATIAVIFVVQYSPALALGLVGALSVVRFRVAIASPEELVYLLLCVSLGVALAAGHLLLGFAALIVVTPFIALRRKLYPHSSERNMVLTLSAHPNLFFATEGRGVIETIKRMSKQVTVERLDHEKERVSLRARVTVDNGTGIMALLSELHEKVPQCQVSTPDINIY